MVQFNGHFDGKVITPDENVVIPVNIPLRVTIEPAREKESEQVDWKRILDLASDCAIEGPSDLAQRHDFYAHGKREE